MEVFIRQLALKIAATLQTVKNPTSWSSNTHHPCEVSVCGDDLHLRDAAPRAHRAANHFRAFQTPLCKFVTSERQRRKYWCHSDVRKRSASYQRIHSCLKSSRSRSLTHFPVKLTHNPPRAQFTICCSFPRGEAGDSWPVSCDFPSFGGTAGHRFEASAGL